MISAFTFSPAQKIPEHVLFPVQTHSANILEVKTGEENLEQCDGLLTKDRRFLLGVQTADCAAITFIGKKYFGVVHAGWRGLQQGIVEKMLAKFTDDTLENIAISPLYPVFEIQKDDCYKRLHEKFGAEFFTEKNGKIFFFFLEALQSILPFSSFCHESTYKNKKWASWRRDGTNLRNKTVIGDLSLLRKSGTIARNVLRLI